MSTLSQSSSSTPNIEVIIQTYREHLSSIQFWYGSGGDDRKVVHPDEEPILINHLTYFFLLLLESVEYELDLPADIISHSIDLFTSVSALEKSDQASELVVCIMGLFFEYFCKRNFFEKSSFLPLYNYLLARISPTHNSIVVQLRVFHYLVKGIPHDRDHFHYFLLPSEQMSDLYGTFDVLVKVHIPKILTFLSSSSSFFGFGKSSTAQSIQQQLFNSPQNQEEGVNNPLPRQFDPMLQRLSILRYIAEFLDILCCYCPRDSDYKYHFLRWFVLLTKIFEVNSKALEHNQYSTSRLVWESTTQLLVTFTSFLKTTIYFFSPTSQYGKSELSTANTPALNDIASVPAFTTPHLKDNNGVKENEKEVKPSQIYSIVISRLSSETFLPTLISLIPQLNQQQTQQSKQALNNILDILLLSIDSEAGHTTEVLISITSMKIITAFLDSINQLEQPGTHFDHPIDLAKIFTLLQKIFINHDTVSKYHKITQLYEHYGIYQHIYRLIQLFSNFVQKTPTKRRCSSISTTSPLSSVSLLSHNPDVTSVDQYLEQKNNQDAFESYLISIGRSLCPLVTSISSIHHLSCKLPCNDNECEWYYRLSNNPIVLSSRGHFDIDVLRLQVDLFHKKQYHKHFYAPLITACVGGKMTSGLVVLLRGILDITGLCSHLLERPQNIPGGYNFNDIYSLYHDVYQTAMTSFCLYYPDPQLGLGSGQVNKVMSQNDDMINDRKSTFSILKTPLSPTNTNTNTIVPPTPTPTRPSSTGESISINGSSQRPLSGNDIEKDTFMNKNDLNAQKALLASQWFKSFNPLIDQDPIAYLTYCSFFLGYPDLNSGSTTNGSVMTGIDSLSTQDTFSQSFQTQSYNQSFSIGSSYSLISTPYSHDQLQSSQHPTELEPHNNILTTPLRQREGSHNNRSKRSTSQPRTASRATIISSSYFNDDENNDDDELSEVVRIAPLTVTPEVNKITTPNPQSSTQQQNGPVPTPELPTTTNPSSLTSLALLDTEGNGDESEQVSYTYAAETPNAPMTPFELSPPVIGRTVLKNGQQSIPVSRYSQNSSPSIPSSTTHHPNLRQFYGLQSNFNRLQQISFVLEIIQAISKQYKRILKNYPSLQLKQFDDHSAFVQLYNDDCALRRERELKGRSANNKNDGKKSQKNGKNGRDGDNNDEPGLLEQFLGPENIIVQWYSDLSSNNQTIVAAAAVAIPIVTTIMWLWWKNPKDKVVVDSEERFKQIEVSYQNQQNQQKNQKNEQNDEKSSQILVSNIIVEEIPSNEEIAEIAICEFEEPNQAVLSLPSKTIIMQETTVLTNDNYQKTNNITPLNDQITNALIATLDQLEELETQQQYTPYQEDKDVIVDVFVGHEKDITPIFETLDQMEQYESIISHPEAVEYSMNHIENNTGVPLELLEQNEDLSRNVVELIHEELDENTSNHHYHGDDDMETTQQGDYIDFGLPKNNFAENDYIANQSQHHTGQVGDEWFYEDQNRQQFNEHQNDDGV